VRRAGCLIAAPALLAGAPTRAQDEIVVTGRGLGDAPGSVAAATVTLARDRLTSTASGRIEDALRDVAGLQQFRRADARSANPTSQGVTLRGLGGNASGRAEVLLDGVPQGDPFAGYVNWPLYRTERVGRIRVTRGGGPGGLAGTIAMDSVAADEGGRLSAALAGGSFASGEGHAQLAGRIGGGFSLVSAAYARSDGFVPVAPAQQGPVDRGADYAQGSVAARGVIALGSGELQAAIDMFDDRRSRGTDFTANTTRGANASLRYVGRRWSALAYVQLRAFTSQFAAVNAARTTVTPTLDQYNTPATGMGAAVEARPDIGPTSLRLGLDIRRTSGLTRERFAFVGSGFTRLREAGGRNTVVGALIEATRKIGAATVTASARLDRWTIAAGWLDESLSDGTPVTATRFATRSGWEPSGRIGFALAATDTLSLRAAAHRGWRLPTLNELYRPFRVGVETTAANAALTPERASGVEAGLDWTPGPGVTVSATGFVTRLAGAIANVTVSTSATAVQRERRNINAIDVRGVEVDAAWRRGDWRLSGSLAWTRSRVAASGVAVALAGLRPAGVAPLQASATLGWRGLSATLRHVAAQFDDDLNQRRLSPATTLDLVARLPLARGIALDVRGENIFDTQVVAALGPTGVVERAAPRTVWLGVRIER